MDKLKMHTENKVDINIEKIGSLFPNTLTEKIKGYDENNKPITEKAIDFDILKQELSKVIVEGREERYQMNWPGKKEAILTANAPINKTLRPCREESVDFDSTENLYIEGDNLEVLKLLQETYLNKVKMIYIDPPYNTGNDSFVYNDDFSMSNEDFSEASGQYDEDGNMNYDIRKNSESNGRFHTDWLNMMYPRLKLARDLLTEDGVIFISIDDYELNNMKKMCDQIFGESNYLNQIVWQRNSSGKTVSKNLIVNIEYMLIYSKSYNYNFNPIYKPLAEATVKMYSKDDNDGRGKYRLYPLQKTSSPGPETTYDYVDNNGKVWKCPAKGWRMNKHKLKLLENDGRLCLENDSLSEKAYWNERASHGKLADTLWSDMPENNVGTSEVSSLFDKVPVFNNPKPTQYLMRLLKMQTQKNNNDIILDFFSGSSSTAHAVMQLNAEDGGNRKFIMVQLPEETDEKSEARKAGYENICEIGKERIRRAGKKIKEENPAVADKLDTGFRVLKLDSSNMKDVYYNPSDYNQDMIEALESNIKDDRSNEDLLFQVMLDLGELLSSDIKEIDIQGKKVFNVGDGSIVACFDNDITNEVLTEIAKMQPFYAIFRDSSLSNDSVVTNFEQIFKTYSPNTITKVL